MSKKKPVGLLRSGTQRESYITMHTFNKPDPHNPRPHDPRSRAGRYQMTSTTIEGKKKFLNQEDEIEKLKENLKKSIVFGKKLMDELQGVKEENKILTKSVENFHIDNTLLTNENQRKDEEIKKLKEEIKELKLELEGKGGKVDLLMLPTAPKKENMEKGKD